MSRLVRWFRGCDEAGCPPDRCLADTALGCSGGGAGVSSPPIVGASSRSAGAVVPATDRPTAA